MKRFLLFLVVVSLVVPVISFAVVAAKQTATIRIISRVEVNKSKDVKGLFEGLTAEASKLGLSEAVINGKLTYQRLPNKSTRVKIQWHSLGSSKGGATEPLKTPLWSQITVKDPKIEPGTKISAKGDLEGVTESFLALKEKAESETPRHLVNSKETNKTKNSTKLVDNGIAPSSGGSSAGASDSGSTGSTGENTSVTTDLLTTSWEKCQPRIDAEGGLLFLQARRTERNENGDITDQGDCLDTGETVIGVRDYASCTPYVDNETNMSYDKYALKGQVDGVEYVIADCVVDPERSNNLLTTTWEKCLPRIDADNGLLHLQTRKIEKFENGDVFNQGLCADTGETISGVRDYSACTDFIDTASMKVFEKYNMSASIETDDFLIRECTIEPERFFVIEATQNQCGMRHDFETGESIEQERLFYTDAKGAVIDISACQDSATKYTHFLTEQTCVPTVDNVAGVVFINKRTAYLLTDGTMDFANECRPVNQAGTPIHEEYCTPKYEHDFVNNVSYYSTRDYYLDELAEAQYLTGCSRSSLASFPHTFETAGCGVTHNDTLMQTVFKAKKEISTPDDGIIEIAPCEDQGAPTSYAYLRADSVSQPNIVTNLGAVPALYGGSYANCSGFPLYSAEGLSRAGVMWTSPNTTLSVLPVGLIETGFDQDTWEPYTIYTSRNGAHVRNASCEYRTGSPSYNENWYASLIPGYPKRTKVRSTVAENTQYKVYLRGDASEFWKENGSHVTLTLDGL